MNEAEQFREEAEAAIDIRLPFRVQAKEAVDVRLPFSLRFIAYSYILSGTLGLVDIGLTPLLGNGVLLELGV